VVLLLLVGLAPLAAVFLAGRGAEWLLETFVQTRWLWLLLAVNLAVLAVRAFAVVDAYRAVPGERQSGPAAYGMVAALLVGIAVPHAIVSDYGVEAIDLIDTVFAADDVPPLDERIAELIAAGVAPEDLGPELSTTTTTVGVTTPPSTLPPNAFELGKELIPESDRFPYEPEIEPREVNLFDSNLAPGEVIGDLSRLTVLLAGGDAGPGRWGLRTDVMIVASIDLITNKAVLFTISRNLSRVPLPPEFSTAFIDREYEYAVAEERKAAAEEDRDPEEIDRETFPSCHCWVDRINALHTYTNNWVRTFPTSPDPGMEALRRTLTTLLGIRVDYYVLVDMAGFVELVDALGGVEVTLAAPMDVAYSPANEGEDPVSIDLPAGIHHLDGRTALAYVRDRSDSGDDARTRRQRCMLEAVADAAHPTTLATRFPEIAAAIRTSTITNVPLSLVPELVGIAASLTEEDIATLAINYRRHSSDTDYRGQPIVNTPAVRATVEQALADAAEGGAGDYFTTDECP
jgi:LCP family protein required for cell wall assembly